MLLEKLGLARGRCQKTLDILIAKGVLAKVDNKTKTKHVYPEFAYKVLSRLKIVVEESIEANPHI